jgi:uncharacterized protein YuzE
MTRFSESALTSVANGVNAFSTSRSRNRCRRVKLHYYPETDSLYIELNPDPGADSREITNGLVVDVDADGNPVGFDIDHASEKLDLGTLKTIALPTVHTSMR